MNYLNTRLVGFITLVKFVIGKVPDAAPRTCIGPYPTPTSPGQREQTDSTAREIELTP
jgi:hypothetical protein